MIPPTPLSLLSSFNLVMVFAVPALMGLAFFGVLAVCIFVGFRLRPLFVRPPAIEGEVVEENLALSPDEVVEGEWVPCRAVVPVSRGLTFTRH